MGINVARRGLLGLIGAAALVRPAATLTRAAGPAFLVPCRTADGFELRLLAADGSTMRRVPLPGRAHGSALSPDGAMAIVFARRPDRFAVAIPLTADRPPIPFEAPAGRHFFGHGFFLPDGTTLAATENDYDAARGVLGLYDARDDFRRIGEWESFGIGPHQALMSSDGGRIVVANGGIETHPDFPRQKLNLASMDPSLTYLDARTGALLGQVRLPAAWHQVSIRHIAEAADGAIWIGGQYEGPAGDPAPVVGYHRPGEDEIAVPNGIARLSRAAKGYIGSVCASGGRVAVTTPRGGLMVEYDTATGTEAARYDIPDVCGLAPLGDGFLATDGTGGIWHDGLRIASVPALAWDNHAAALERYVFTRTRPGSVFRSAGQESACRRCGASSSALDAVRRAGKPTFGA